MPSEDVAVPYHPNGNWVDISGSFTSSHRLKARQDPMRQPWESVRGSWRPISPTTTMSDFGSHVPLSSPSLPPSSSPPTVLSLPPPVDITAAVMGAEIHSLESDQSNLKRQIHNMMRSQVQMHRELTIQKRHNTLLKECVSRLGRYIESI